MDRTSPIAQLLSRAFVALTVLALAVRFALPAGTMLEKPAEDGALPSIIVCTSAGMVKINAGGDYGIPGKAPSKHSDDGKSPEMCPFAGMSAPVIAPSIVVLAAVAAVPAEAVLPWIAEWQRPGLGLVAPPPPSTGPPSIV
jgi:hypothetical protein